MIIVYPATNFNSFATVVELTLVMDGLYPEYGVKFKAMTPEQQEASAINAGEWIRTCKGLKYPSPLPQDFVLSQVIIMATRVDTDTLAFDGDARAVTSETVGEISVSYDSRYKSDGQEVNPLVYRYLSPYGCSKAGGFKMAPLGRA